MPLQSRFISSDIDDNDEKPITVTASHSLPPLVARCPTPVGDRQKRSITTIAEQIAKKVKTSQNDEIGTCDWCFQAKPPQFCLPPDSATTTTTSNKLFCSDQCFSQYRRAIFKQSTECDACKKTIQTTAALETLVGELRLHFCDAVCQQAFDSVSLQPHPVPSPDQPDPLLVNPAHILLVQAKAYLQNQLQASHNKERVEAEVQKENDKPKLTIKPDHILKTPVNINKNNILRRMALQDKQEPEGSKARTRHGEFKKQEQNQNYNRLQRFSKNQATRIPPNHGEDKVNLHHPPPLLLPPMPPIPLLPPPTMILPFPIFLPIPIPIPIPVPTRVQNDNRVADKTVTKAEVCQENEKDYDDIGPRENPLIENIKQEKESENSIQQVFVEAKSPKPQAPEVKLNPIMLAEGSNSDDEFRRKRRAFIMDQCQ